MTVLHCGTEFHADSGSHLGSYDPHYGSTRLPEVVDLIAGTGVIGVPDGYLMLGDLTRTPTPTPQVLAMLQGATADWPQTLWMRGNHDHDGSALTGLNVVARSWKGDVVVDEPALHEIAGVQVACLPWTPAQRLYGQARGDRSKAHAAAGEMLVQIAAGLMAQADRSRPVVLVGHWLLAGTDLASGTSVLEAHEPLVAVEDLEALGFAAVLFGHNHAHQQVGDRSWVVGPPARTGWGERDQPTGYLRLEIHDDGTIDVERRETPDRPMVDLGFSGPCDPRYPDGVIEPLEGALVRVRVTCEPSEAEGWQQRAVAIRESLLDQGAHLVQGPDLTVTRQRRRRIENLDVETDPVTALERWLDEQSDPPEPGLRDRALVLASTITGGR